MNYRKVNNNLADKLSLNETRTYFGLLVKSDYNTQESFINEETLADYLNIVRSTVSDHLHKIEEAGLIEIKTTKYNCSETGQIHLKNTYILKYDQDLDLNGNKYDCHWVLIDEDLLKLQLQHELVGFLIKLKTICINNTNTCAWSTRKIGEAMNLGKTSVDNYLKKAEKAGLISWDKKKRIITILNKEIFIETNESEIAQLRRLYPEIITD